MNQNALTSSRFLKAARREPVDCTPAWIMRQAGRYLPEYRQVRDRVTFLELCHRPELAAEVTLTAQRVLDTDAAILFADLLPILVPMGLDLEFAKGEGPIIHNPLKGPDDLPRFRELENLDELGFVYDAVRLIRKELPENIPLLGFAGAPFTLASYAIEGGGSRSFQKTKSWMYRYPEAWEELMERLSRTISRYLAKQLESGCQAVQIFDSWAGCLSPGDYDRFALPYTEQIIKSLPGAVVINFLTGNPSLIELQAQAGGTIIGLDWRCELRETWEQLGDQFAVQGNLDPINLLGGWDHVRTETARLLDSVYERPGHIFNLGHGVLPETDPQIVKDLICFIHEYTSE